LMSPRITRLYQMPAKPQTNLPFSSKLDLIHTELSTA
jgi:hypothetical protein